MNVTLNKTSDVTGTLTVEVVENDYAAKVKSELKKIGQTHPIPGFRAGKVPTETLRRRFGRQVKSDVLNNEVFNAAINYIRENKLHILGEPMPAEMKEVNMEDKDYTFVYELGFAPEINVVLDKDVKLPYYTIAVSDEMRNEQDTALRERFGTQGPGETVEGKALVKGTIMQLNEDGTINENEGAIQVLDGIVAPYAFQSKDETEKFMGKHVNDKVVFNPWNTCNGNAIELSSMLNIDKEIAGDIKGDFEMTIAEIVVVKPAEHDQEFFDNVFGKDQVHNEEEYNKALTDMIARQLVGNSEAWFEKTTRDYLMEKYGEMNLPLDFLKRWLVARNEELTEENIDKEMEMMMPQVKWDLISERVAALLDVKVEEADLINHAKAIAYRQFAQYGITNMDDETLTDTAKRILGDNNYRDRIAEQVAQLKLYAAIREAVTIESKEISLDEFKKMVGAE